MRTNFPRRAGSHRLAVLAACASIAAAASCADAPGGRANVPYDSDDVALELRIDGHEADLVPISWVGVSRSGVIALVQMQDQNVRLFDPSGASLGTFGRDGEGPGEFRRPLRGGWTGDTLWISDTALNRVTLTGPDLDLRGTLTVPQSIRPLAGSGDALFGTTVPYGVLGGDTLLLAALSGSGSTPAQGYPVLRATTDGTLVNEVTRVPIDERGSVRVRTDRGVTGMRVPFAARPDWAVSPDGRRVAVLTHATDEAEGRFHVEVYAVDGTRLVERDFPFTPVRIPASTVDSAIAAATARQAAVQRPLEDALRDAVPATYPGAERVLIGQDDRVWIGLWPEPQGQRWIVLASDGAAADTVLLPAGTRLQAASATHVWATERDALDVESVLRFRITGGAH